MKFKSVGASVWKFYSEVKQDLDPPSSVHPGKVASPEITVDKWDVGKTYKRPTSCVKRVYERTGTNRVSKGSNGLGIVMKDGGHASSVKRLNLYWKTSLDSAQNSQLMKGQEQTESRSDALSRGNPRSYKKAIREAFSSKKKASMVREYEQLTVLYSNCSAQSGTGGTSDAHISSECEWEIL